MGRLAESTDCSIRIVQRLISGKEKKGKGRDGWRRWSAKRPAARLPKNIKKLDGPGWVKAYIRWRQSLHSRCAPSRAAEGWRWWIKHDQTCVQYSNLVDMPNPCMLLGATCEKKGYESQRVLSLRRLDPSWDVETWHRRLLVGEGGPVAIHLNSIYIYAYIYIWWIMVWRVLIVTW